MHIVLLDDDGAFTRRLAGWVKRGRESDSVLGQISTLNTFESGDEFLQQLEQSAKAPEGAIAIVDLAIHGDKKAGLKILNAIRQNTSKVVRSIPVIIYSSSQMDTDIVGSYESLANSFVWKGIGTEQKSRFTQLIGDWMNLMSLPTKVADQN